MLLANNYLINANDENTKKRSEMCSKLIIETPERRDWPQSGVFIFTSEHILHFFPVFLSLTLKI